MGRSILGRQGAAMRMSRSGTQFKIDCPGNYPLNLLVDHCIRQGTKVQFKIDESEQRDVVMVLVDVHASTAMSYEDIDYLRRIRKFFQLVDDVAGRQFGTINKYLGDGALVHFHSLENAIGAALLLHRRMIHDVKLDGAFLVTQVKAHFVRLGGLQYKDFTPMAARLNLAFKLLKKLPHNVVYLECLPDFKEPVPPPVLPGVRIRRSDKCTVITVGELKKNLRGRLFEVEYAKVNQ